MVYALPAFTSTVGVGGWKDAAGKQHFDKVLIVTVITEDKAQIKAVFDSVVARLKELGEQVVLVSYQPTSFSLE